MTNLNVSNQTQQQFPIKMNFTADLTFDDVNQYESFMHLAQKCKSPSAKKEDTRRLSKLFSGAQESSMIQPFKERLAEF